MIPHFVGLSNLKYLKEHKTDHCSEYLQTTLHHSYSNKNLYIPIYFYVFVTTRTASQFFCMLPFEHYKLTNFFTVCWHLGFCLLFVMETKNFFLPKNRLFLKYFFSTYKIVGFYIYSWFDDEKSNLKTVIRYKNRNSAI